MPLAYSRLSYPEKCGVVNPLNGDIVVTVRATFTVFCPRPGMQLDGTVNKVSVDHVGLVVHGVFNCAIASTEMPPGAYYEEVEQVWRHVNSEAFFIGEGQLVRFVVKSVAADGTLIMIQASLRDPDLPEPVDASATGKKRRRQELSCSEDLEPPAGKMPRRMASGAAVHAAESPPPASGVPARLGEGAR